jgi:signal peptidase II
MSGPRRLERLSYALAAAVVVCDQALKYWILEVYRLPDRLADQAIRLGVDSPSLPVIGPFHLALVSNRGVSFGFLNLDSEWTRWALAAFSAAVALALGLWARRIERPILSIAVGLIMGGALGNLIDRVRLGAVVDFLDFSRLWFPWVFNLADSAITIGSVLLIWELFVAPRTRAHA